MRKLACVVIGLGLLLAAWEGLVLTGRYPPALLPPPVKVLSGFKEIAGNGSLFEHLLVTLRRFFIGYLSASLAGMAMGLVFGWLTRLWAVAEPVVHVLRPISPVAWFPFIVMWFGIGDIPAIVIIFISAFFPVLLSTVAAIRLIDPIYLKVAANFGIKPPRLLLKIIFPAIFPNIVTGLHLALGTAWIFMVAGEMLGTQSGLGFLIIDARNGFRTDLVVCAMITIGVLGLVLDRAIALFESWANRVWGVGPAGK
ncbi:MAG: ABC transporter permease [Deltaproteobacteria bacterium]|jgi:NitT/TauT family transport system permease protein|nr:ABC transporter permease [Deltaproteobacteria bacterium]